MVPAARRYQYFQQSVRRFRRRDLLLLTATVASALEKSGGHRLVTPAGRATAITQFTLSAIAKEAVLCGNEYRSAVATVGDLDRMSRRLFDATEHPRRDDPDFLRTLLVQTSFEQFPWQFSQFAEMARTHALYVDAADDMGSPVINAAFWQQVLGCSVPEYFGALFVWFAGAAKNHGLLDAHWPERENSSLVRATVDAETLRNVLERLTATREQLQTLADTSRLDQRYRRYEFNPLQARPVVDLGAGELIAPQPLFIARKTTATGLFYDAIGAAGKEFADELGYVFEHYVGMNLRAISEVEVYDQIAYGKPQNKSVDYFVDTGESLLLVEVKSTRLSAEARAGGPRLADDLQRGLGIAFNQIRKSVDEIVGNHPSFAQLPRRQRLVGLVVTLEPYFMAHMPDIRSFAGTDPGVPTVVASARELERLVAVNVPVGPLLDTLFADPILAPGALPHLGSILDGQPRGRNPLLEQAWANYPWGHGRRDE